MQYLKPSFTLPVAQGVSKEEWDRIWQEYKPKVKRVHHPAPFPIGWDLIAAVRKDELNSTRAEGRNRRKAYRLSDINRTVEKRTGKSPALCSDAR